MTSAFSFRSDGYIGGVVTLFLSTGVTLGGFGSPHWEEAESKGSSMGIKSLSFNHGLWTVCIGASGPNITIDNCYSYGTSGLPDWFHAVRAMSCISVMGLVAACIYTIAVNCCRSYPGAHNRVLEIIACASGLVGFVSCMVFVGVRSQNRSDNDFVTLVVKLTLPTTLHWSFAWAMYLTAVGSCVAIIAGIIIFITNKPIEDEVGDPRMEMGQNPRS